MPRIPNLDTENTAPLGSDMGVMVDAPATTAETQKFYWGGMNLLPDATAYNYTIAVSVASNNLTCALKTKAGGDPSATDPVSAWLYGSYYRCTGALSATVNAGVGQFNMGSLEFYGQTVRMFVYLAYRAASSALVLGFSRIPYARIVSDFSTTAGNERYCAWSTAPASTDNCFVIGAFSAICGVGAAYNWSIPTATNETVIQHPIYVSGRRAYAAQVTGFSTAPSAASLYSYMIEYDKITVVVRQVDDNSSVSNATSFSVSVPMSPPTITNALWSAPAIVTDNGSITTSPGLAHIASAGTSFTIFKTYAAAAGSWTASGEKYCNAMTITYPLKA